MVIDLATINFCPGEGGGKPAVVEELSVTANGVYIPGEGVDGYAPVTVDVQPVLEQKTITENGKYVPEEGTDGWNEIDVEVPQKEEIDLNWHIVDNGQVTFNAPDGKTYKKVVMDVDVPQEVEGYSEKDLTEKTFTIVNLNNSASYVASKAFSTNNDLLTVNLPKCNSVYISAFAYCSNLNTVNLPVATYVGTWAFQNCGSLQNINMPNLKIIDNQPFLGCSNLTEISFPYVISIGNSAFANCSRLNTVNLPNITSLSYSTFNNCYSLNSISLPKIIEIGSYAFNGCSGLNSIDMPAISIKNAAFQKCISLQTVNMSNLMFMENSAFIYCYSLQTVNIPNAASVAGCVFQYCSNLIDITIPAYYISGATLLNCSNLTTARFPGLISVDKWWGNPIINNTSPNFSQLYLGTEAYGVLPYDYIISGTPINSGNGSIYVNAYDYSRYITASGWSSLSSIIVPVGDPDVPMLSYTDSKLYGNTMAINGAFSVYLGHNDNWREIDLPNVRNIAAGTFQYTNYLSTVNIPNVRYIGYNAFSRCYSIQTVNMSNAIYIDGGAFDECYSLQSVDIPNVRHIGYNAFYGCRSLQTVNMSNVLIMSDRAFAECRSLSSVDLPNMISCGGDIFISCSNLSKVIIGTNVSYVVPIGRDIFAYTPMWSTQYLGYYGSIYVPASLVDEYKSATNWVTYRDRITAIPE